MESQEFNDDNELGPGVVKAYSPGGLHPIDIGDLIQGRFEVFHKLGAGGFGEVWLCSDKEIDKWRALKILTAAHSDGTTNGELKVFKHLQSRYSPKELEQNHIAAPIEHLYIDGPNGRHLCFVLPVLGSSVETWSLSQKPLEEGTSKVLKDVCRQLAKGVRFLHRNGVVHGDIKPTNVMMKLSGIDDLSRDQMSELLGEPESFPIKTPCVSAPKYYVNPLDEYWCESLIIPEIAIIDYGESFCAESPRENWGIPLPYAAPEVVFPKSEGADGYRYSSDVWSTACTMYEIKTSYPMFESCHFPERLVRRMELYFGPLPEVYLAAWNAESSCTRVRCTVTPDEGKPFEDLHYVMWERTELGPKRDDICKDTGCSDPLEADLLEERQYNIEVPGSPIMKAIKYRYPREDTLLFSDLLHGMLKYGLKDRMSMEDVCRHPWLDERNRCHVLFDTLRRGITIIFRGYPAVALGVGVITIMAAVFSPRLGGNPQSRLTPLYEYCYFG